MSFRTVLLPALAVFAAAEARHTEKRTPCGSGVAPGEGHVICEQVPANGFYFDCRIGTPDGASKGNVVLLHGFPEWSSMWQPLMNQLAEAGYSSVACDQRGYSPHARPENETDYNYNKLRSDIFAVAEAVGFAKFHLVAHDHGAVLGYYAAGSDLGKSKIQSVSALSIPHPNAFAEGLYGPEADVDQQSASQYFTMFVKPNSAHSVSFCAMGLASGFSSCDDFQKAMWWYNGAMNVGVLSMPPLMSASELNSRGWTAMAALRLLWGGTPNKGYAGKFPTGDMIMPTLFVCGKKDSAILCDHPFALKTKDHCKGGYTYLEVDAGHTVTGNTDGQVEGAILKHIESVQPVKFSLVI